MGGREKRDVGVHQNARSGENASRPLTTNLTQPVRAGQSSRQRAAPVSQTVARRTRPLTARRDPAVSLTTSTSPSTV